MAIGEWDRISHALLLFAVSATFLINTHYYFLGEYLFYFAVCALSGTFVVYTCRQRHGGVFLETLEGKRILYLAVILGLALLISLCSAVITLHPAVRYLLLAALVQAANSLGGSLAGRRYH